MVSKEAPVAKRKEIREIAADLGNKPRECGRRREKKGMCRVARVLARGPKRKHGGRHPPPSPRLRWGKVPLLAACRTSHRGDGVLDNARGGVTY